MIPILLDWFRDPEGYTIERVKGAGAFLVGISGTAVTSRPLADNEMLYAEFAGIRTADELVKFANKYGPPTGHRPMDYLAEDERQSPAPRGGRNSPSLWEPVIIPERSVRLVSRSPVQNHVRYAQLVRRVLESEHLGSKSSRKDAYRAVGEILAWEYALGYIQLYPKDDEAGFEFSFVAASLMGAIWLQLGQRAGRGVRLCECRHCGAWFEKGPGTGKRKDADFCSSSHKVAFHRKHKGD